MTDAKINAPYIDPAFKQLGLQVNACSDRYPVLMLPVRMETCFKNAMRFVTVHNPNAPRITQLLNQSFDLIYDTRVWLPTAGQKTDEQIVRKIEVVEKKVASLIENTGKISGIRGNERVILREAFDDLKEELAKLELAKRGVVKTAFKNLNTTLEGWSVAIENIEREKSSPAEKGSEMVSKLGDLEKQISRIYVDRTANALSLHGNLVQVDAEMDAIHKLIESPDFFATKAQVKSIQSKISAIKRTQKNSPVRLMDYKTGFIGTYNLQEKEYKLRGEINNLKARIDRDYVPYMELLLELKHFPVRHLTYYIDKAATLLKASNRVGYKSAEEILNEKNWLYKQLNRIRNRAHRPLEGDVSEIHALKAEYKILNDEILNFIDHASKIKTKVSAEKTAISRLQTHLRKEYLEDLKNLLPGVQSLEAQSFDTQKVRHTASNAQRTIDSIYDTKQWVKSNTLNRDSAVLQLNASLETLKRDLMLSTSHSVLLPRTMYHGTKNEFNSLKSHIQNLYTRFNVSNTHPIRAAIGQQLSDMERLLNDQFMDVFNEKDPFYDDFRKRITFLVKAEFVRELWVRVYPDDIAVDNHDERISDNEEKVGKEYYKAVYSLPPVEREAAKLPAFRAVAASLGARRAAYVIQKLLPPQVTNNLVANPTNNLQLLVDTLKTIYTIEGNSITANESAANQAFLINLPQAVQNMLAPHNFSACTRTQPTVDALLKYLSAGLSFQQHKIMQQPGGTPAPSDQQILDSIKLAYEFTYQYAANEADKLHQPFDPPFTWPEVEKKEKTWDRAGITNVMPDRFIVVTKRGDAYRQVVVGKPVKKDLALSIDPAGEQADEFKHDEQGDLQLPESLRWMFDFDAAVEAGMGIRVPLQQEDFDSGFDFVMVYGMQTHANVPDGQRHLNGQQMVNELFNNHIYTEGGLEYLPVGTATNNTESVKSPYHSMDDDWDGIYDLYLNPTVAHGALPYTVDNELHMTDGQFFSDMLGLPKEMARLIRHHDKKDIANGRAMNRALYGITLKHYMQVMTKGLVNSNDIFHTLPFLMNHVSAVGTLPAFRVDKQPYGIVPITLLDKFWSTGNTAKGSQGSYIKHLSLFLKATRDIFSGLEKNKVHTINSNAYNSDPQKVFLEILGLEPHSKEFFYRAGANLTGRWGDMKSDSFDFKINWYAQDVASPWALSGRYGYLISRLGPSTLPAQANTIMKTAAYKNRYTHGNNILGHIIQDPALGTEFLKRDSNNKNYLHNLRDYSHNRSLLLQIPRSGNNTIYQNTLLFNLVRGALLNDNSFRAQNAVAHIAGLDIPTLERLLANHIDLLSYRLDAWITGLANFRLHELRHAANGSQGTFIGAYGFVEGLRRAPQKVRIDHLPDGLTPNDGSDVYTAPDNQGFIHGPNMNHAITAAVLRAGFNSQKQKAKPGDNAFAINLSSARVRKALHLLEGVSQGQELGALLGYRFERALHEKYRDDNGNHLEMNTFIYPLRRKFPTFREINAPNYSALSTVQKENLKATNVIDGLEMLDHFEAQLKAKNLWSDDKTFVEMIISQVGGTTTFNGYPWGFQTGSYPEIPANNNDINRLKLKAFIYELDELADAIDAMGDLVTAEGVYQLVRGNHTRAGAVLNAMSEGKVPPDPEIIKSMREGNMVNHRMVLGVEPVSGSVSPWAGVPQSPRGLAEPSLNHWLAQQIGDPEAIDWWAQYGNTQTYISLKDLKMQPIDVVLLTLTGGEEATREWEHRCADFLRMNVPTTGSDIHINFNEKSSGAVASLGEMLSLFRHLGKLIAKSRVADARDFRVAEDAANFGMSAPAIDKADLQLRLTNALVAYKHLLNSLVVFNAAKTTYTTAEAELAINKLKELSLWSFTGYYPTDEDADNVLSMASKIVSAKESMAQTIAMAEEVMNGLPLEADHTKWLSASEDLAKKFFGASFKIMPRIQISNLSDLNVQFNEPHGTGLLRHLSEDGLEDWLSDAALVRKPLSYLENTILLKEAIHGQSIALRVAQLPAAVPGSGAEPDYWLGAEYPESFEPDGDRLSLIVAGSLPAASGALACALLMDEWMEIIPTKKQTTGIAIHYNQPDARPPQTLLLAVTPQITGQWSLDDLGLIVEEAYNLAKLRAVEPEHVDFSILGQMLPATATLFEGDKTDVQKAFGFSSTNGLQPNQLDIYVKHEHLNEGFTPDAIEG